MSQVQLRINGKGNAWPVILGQEHPFYNRNDYQDLANASCSILKSKSGSPNEKQIEWEVLVDVGHGIMQYLIKNVNRIPDALILTHSHVDHIVGIDWLVQSYYKTHNKPYPVYATGLTWRKTLSAFPQLNGLVEFNELIPYNQISIKEASGLKLTSYPVYHGQSAEGAAMLLFEIDQKKILVTGDILTPLLREDDFNTIKDLDLLIADANNRFPYPQSNHWSIMTKTQKNKMGFLTEFKKNISLGTILSPHLKPCSTITYSKCFDYFLDKQYDTSHFIFDIMSFTQKVNPKKIVFMHYSGSEDEKYYHEKILNPSQFYTWLEREFKTSIPETSVVIPYVGQHIEV
ncbi:MAG: MBL fold metallo-hydrolase [Bacteroidales bacterium]